MPDSQQQINYGNSANDGTGDPLRTAFIKVDDNFDAIWNAGPVGSNITVLNNTIASVNVNGNIAIVPNGIGMVLASGTIAPALTRSYDLGTTNLRWRNIYANTITANNITYNGNVFTGNLEGNVLFSDGETLLINNVTGNITANSATISGNISADYFVGNGSLLTGITSSYGNANVAAYLPTYNGNLSANIVDTGTISHPFPITIQSNGNVWEFADDIFRAPQGGSWESATNTEYITSNPNGFINLISYSSGNLATELYMEHGFVRIRVDNGGPEKDWNFLVNGTLTVPGDIIPTANGVYSLGNATNYWSNLWVVSNTIYIGGVALGVIGNVLTVNGEPVLSNDSDSSIITTGNLAAGNILTDNYFYANGEPFVSSSTGNITFVNTTMSSPDGDDLFITAANAEVEITGEDFRVEVTDDVRIQGNDIVSIRNTSSVDPITIITDYNGIARTWEFDATGNLRTPGDITVAGGITGTSSASTLVLAAEPNSNTAIQLNDTVDSIINTVANLEISTDVANTVKTWRFDTLGNLVVPGNINFGGDSSAAPSLNDFFSVTSAVGFDIVANTSGTVKTFSFDADGDLTAPGNLSANLIDTGTISHPFPITIQSNGNVWEFADDIFRAPQGGSWESTANTEYITSNPNGFINLIAYNSGNLATELYMEHGFVRIRVDNGGPEKDWNFLVDGTLNAPGNIVTSGNVTGANLVTTGNVVGNVGGYSIGYRDIPQISFIGNATIATTDAGKHYYSIESSDYVLTIANNSSQNFAVGAAISIVNQGTGNITIAQGSGVSLYLAGNATSGNRTLTTFGMATIMKVATDTWFVNGSGIS
jgi:hypothetical protein